MGRVIFLVGASGAGKSAAALELETRAPWSGRTFFFDDIGVPSADEMKRVFPDGRMESAPWMATAEYGGRILKAAAAELKKKLEDIMQLNTL